MGWHLPRFKLSGLVVLVAVVAVECAAIPAPLSWCIASLSLASALLASALAPITIIEWFGFVSVHIFVFGLLAGARIFYNW